MRGRNRRWHTPKAGDLWRLKLDGEWVGALADTDASYLHVDRPTGALGATPAGSELITGGYRVIRENGDLDENHTYW